MSVPGRFPRRSSLPGVRASPHTPTPTGGCREVVGCVYVGRGLGRGCLVSRSPPTLSQGQQLPHCGPGPHPAWGRTWRSSQPTRPRLLCPSHWVCFLSLQLSSRDSPVTRHTLSSVGAAASCLPPSQEGDTLCPLLLKTQTKAQPGPGSPARGSGEPGPRPVCCVPLTCLSALGAQGEPVGPRQGVAPGRGLPGGGGVKREETPTQSRGVRYSGWTPLFPFEPPFHSR